jgi:hypothetical protein
VVNFFPVLQFVNYVAVDFFAVSPCFSGNRCLILIPDSEAQYSPEISAKPPNAERYKTLKPGLTLLYFADGERGISYPVEKILAAFLLH